MKTKKTLWLKVCCRLKENVDIFLFFPFCFCIGKRPVFPPVFLPYSHTTITLTILTPGVLGFFPYRKQFPATQQGVLQLISILTVYLEIASDPTGEVLSPTRLLPHPSEANPKARLSLVFMTTGQLCIEGFLDLPLGSINLLELFTELRKTVCLLGYQFIRKGYNSQTAR